MRITVNVLSRSIWAIWWFDSWHHVKRQYVFKVLDSGEDFVYFVALSSFSTNKWIETENQYNTKTNSLYLQKESIWLCQLCQRVQNVDITNKKLILAVAAAHRKYLVRTGRNPAFDRAVVVDSGEHFVYFVALSSFSTNKWIETENQYNTKTNSLYLHSVAR